MKKTLLGIVMLITAYFSSTSFVSAQAVAVDSVPNIITTSLDVYGNYTFFPDSTGVTYFAIADNAGMAGATFSAYIVHNDTMGTWMASFSGLTPGTQYWIQPNGITEAFEFFSGPIVTVTTDTLFTMPSVNIDSLSGITTTSVTINNSVTTGGDTLHLKVTTATNPSFTAGLTWVDITLPIGTTTSSLTVTGLIPNTNYWVKSEVTNRVGTFVCGSILPFTTLDAGVYTIPVSDSSAVTDTSITMYGSSNFADAYYCIVSPDYISIEVLKVGSVVGYNVWGGGAVTSASATFSSDPSTTNYWRFVVQHDGNTYYGNTMTATTLPIDTPILSLSIPIVADTNATAIAFYSTTEPASLFIKYGQPTINIGTQYTALTYVGIGTGTLTETLHNLLAGTSGEAALCAIVHGDTVISSIVSFTTAPAGAVIPFSGFITEVEVDTLLANVKVNFGFISENDVATVWVDIADSADAGYVYPYPGGLPYYFQSYGGTAYDIINVSTPLEVNHVYRCHLVGYNSANAVLFTSPSVFFNTYQDGSIGTFYATPYVPIDYGDNATLHWSTSNASSVIISGIGLVANDGSISTGPLEETTTFILTLTGLSGNVLTDTVTVEVNPTAVETIDLVNQMTLVFNDQFSVNFPEAKIVQVYNLSGVKILESELNSNVSHFNLDQPAGMYLCRTVDATGMISPAKKIILVH